MAALRDTLARERTFLAWLRTAVALLGLGFVVAKLNVLLAELGRSAGTAGARLFTLAGGGLAVLAVVRHLVPYARPAAEERLGRILPLLASALVVALAVLLTLEIGALPGRTAAGP